MSNYKYIGNKQKKWKSLQRKRRCKEELNGNFIIETYN